MPLRWDFSRFNYLRYLHRSWRRFEVQERFDAGLHELQHEGVRHLFLLRRQEEGSRTLLVMLHGAVPAPAESEPLDLALPYFNGMRLTRSVDADALMLNDATLGLMNGNARLGWYSGTTTFDHPEVLRQILAKIIEANEYEKVYFCGGSGGGFAAMRVALDFPGSMAIAWNPQTSIADGPAMLVALYAQAAFGVESFDEIPPDLRAARRMDLLPCFLKGTPPRVLYMQNQSDTFHVDNHLRPFLQGLGATAAQELGLRAATPEILCLMGDWGEGHATPPTLALIAALNLIIGCGGAPETLIQQLPKACPEFFTRPPAAVEPAISPDVSRN